MKEDMNSGEQGLAAFRAVIAKSRSHRVLNENAMSSRHIFTRFALPPVNGSRAVFTVFVIIIVSNFSFPRPRNVSPFSKKRMYLRRKATNPYLVLMTAAQVFAKAKYSTDINRR